MKNCNICQTELVMGANWLASMEKHGIYRCKPCHNKNQKKHYHANSDRYKTLVKGHYNKTKENGYVVYLLETENYVGVTGNFTYRKAVHKHSNRDIFNYRILLETPDRERALELEELLHDMGYEGKHLKNRYL